MAPISHLVRIIKIGLAVVAMTLLFSAGQAVASESAGSWRATYDVVMLWVNFFILAFILYKIGKKPLMDFLAGSRNDIAREIEKLENQREEITAQTEEALKKIETSKTHFKGVSERIIETGEKAKQSIIEDAKKQSRMMLEDTKRKIETQINTAKKDFRSELIDASVDLAMKNIAGYVTQDDNQRLIEQYLSAIPDKK